MMLYLFSSYLCCTGKKDRETLKKETEIFIFNFYFNLYLWNVCEKECVCVSLKYPDCGRNT